MTGRVLGVGSPAGGDRVGWAVVDRLQADGRARDLDLQALDRPGPALVAAMEGADFAVIVDAVRSGAETGTLHRITDTTQLARGPAVSSHGFGLAQALALGERLGALPAWVVIGVEADPGALPPGEALDRAAAAVLGEFQRLSLPGAAPG